MFSLFISLFIVVVLVLIVMCFVFLLVMEDVNISILLAFEPMFYNIDGVTIEPAGGRRGHFIKA